MLGDRDPPRALEHLASARRLTGAVDDRLFAATSETAAATIAARHGDPATRRHGDPAAALAAFREVLTLWRKAGNDTLRANALRNLVVLLARVGADEACVLVDAVLPAAAMYPSEVARLNHTRAAASERLGAARVAEIRERGTALMAEIPACGTARVAEISGCGSAWVAEIRGRGAARVLDEASAAIDEALERLSRPR